MHVCLLISQFVSTLGPQIICNVFIKYAFIMINMQSNFMLSSGLIIMFSA